jgi:putative hemolysin
MALARVRRTRIDQLAEKDNVFAQKVQIYLHDPEKFISACQLGITIATLLLGAAGEAALAEDMAHWAQKTGEQAGLTVKTIESARWLAYAAAFTFTAYVQTVGGELLPKMLTFSRAELVILWTIMPMHFWCIITSPFLKILNGTTAIITKLLRIKEPSSAMTAHTGEELKMLVSASHEEGVLEPEEEEMLHSVFDFADTVASEVMTPRVDLVCVPAEATIKDFVTLALKHGHSRLPVFEEDIDNIFGVIHIRDGLRALTEHKELTHVREFARKVLIVPTNKNLKDLLTEFKRTKTHMAIVMDEYGATQGIVTFEDLLEELVGDIADEHEVVEEYVVKQEDGTYLIDAKLSLEEFNEAVDLSVEDEEFNTIGGHVFGELGREPKPGDEVETDVYILRIEEADRHRILKLRLILKDANGATTEDVEISGSNNNGKHDTKEININKVVNGETSQ